MKLPKTLVSMSALILVLTACIGLLSARNTSAGTIPTARANAILTSTPSSMDVAAITDVIVESYSVRVRGLKTFDTSQYPSVFVDDPSVPLEREQAEYVSKVRARHGNAVRITSGNGWLAYNLMQVFERQQGLAAQQVQTTARAQGRQPTGDEARSAADVNGQPPAPVIYEGSGKQKVTILKANITGDRAVMEYDTPAVTYSVALVKTPNGWRIAGEKVLNVHF